MANMKPSGVQWIGDIPSKWNLAVLGKYVKQVKNKNTALLETNLLSLSYGKIKRKDISANDGLLPASFDGYNIIEEGDIVLRLTDLQNDHTSLRVGRATERGIITSAYITIRPEKYISSKYLYYVLHSFDIVKGFYGMGAGIRQGLTYDGVQSLKIPSPEILEQQAIADYLDDRCSKIDEIIAEATASIEEYKELKQAVIDNGVLHGIRNEEQLKDTGVDWIGSIPVSWELRKVKYVAHFNPSITKQYDEKAPVGYVPMTSVKNGNMLPLEILIKEMSTGLTAFQEDDLVMAKVTPCFENGNISIAKGLAQGVGFGSSELFVFRPYGINRKFLLYYLQNSGFRNKCVSTMTGVGGLKRVSGYFVKNAYVTYPSDKEQQEIVDFLDVRVGDIDSLISEKQSLINDLQAYKKSLIYEVVTGKRRVV